jgi:CCR4-NOT transcription complex subunit 7/8
MSIKPLTKNREIPKEKIIREVYADNFVKEIKNLSTYIEKYKYVAFDTEFPGIVFQNNSNVRDAYYRSIKNNVDKLKLIQLGIALCDEEGNFPPDVNAWQFNLKFDLSSDLYSHESINLLTNSGINFDTLNSRGIPIDLFGEYMISSGLVLNEEIQWITFHGIYDFAYFLRSLANMPLPESEMQFFDQLKIYFPNFYDVRYLVRFHDNFRCSLTRLGQELGLPRTGTMHQAGSDSLLTLEIFLVLIKEYLDNNLWKGDKNVLFGLGAGSEDSEQMGYNSGSYYNNVQKTNSFYEQNYYPNIQYGNYRPNYFVMNGFGMQNYNYNQMNMYQMNTVGNGLGDDKKKFNSKNVEED